MRLKFSRQNSPERWEFDPIGKRIKLNYGKSQAGVRATDGHVPIYGTGGLIEYAQQYLSKGDSILVGRKGTLDNPLYIDHPFWAVDTTYYTSDFDGSTKWLYYIVQTLGLAGLNEATGVPSLARKTFYKLEIPFPPKPEQSLIAEILSTSDHLVAHTEALIAKYQRIKTGLMQDLLTYGLDEHGQLRDPKTHKFKPSPLGWVPEEWEIVTLGEVVAEAKGFIQTGPFGSQLHAHEYTAEGVPVIMPQDIGDDGTLLLNKAAKISVNRANDLKRHIIKPNDVIFARRGDLSRCATVGFNNHGICGTGCLLLRVPEDVLSGSWMSMIYRHAYCQQQIAARAVGSTMVNLNTKLLSDLLLAKPEIQEQRAISDSIYTFYTLLHSEKTYYQKLISLKTGLMQDLLTGKVSVEPLLA
jgi:type I restriction enzyme S subunit